MTRPASSQEQSPPTRTSRLARLIGLAAIAAAGLVAAPAQAAAEFTLTYADHASDRGPRAEALKWWAETLGQRSGGRLAVEFYWGGSVAGSKNTLRAVNSGLADMGTLIGITHAAESGMWLLGEVPFTVADPWVGMRGMYEARQTNPAFASEAEDNGYKVLFQNTAGSIELLCRDGFHDTVEKLQGVKVRANGGHLDLFAAMGANTLTTAGEEVYTGLDRGIFDCTIWYTQLVKSYKLYEVAGYLTLAGMGQPVSYGGIINLDTFNDLPADLQQILVETSVEYMDVYARNLIEGTEAAAAAMQAGIDGHKLQINELTPEERARWKALAAPLIGKWKAESGLSPKEADRFVADVEAAMAKYRAILADEGYPWTR